MKKSEIEVGKTYHNGKERRTERKVTNIFYTPNSDKKRVAFKTIKGMQGYEEHNFGAPSSYLYLEAFAKWAKGVVE